MPEVLGGSSLSDPLRFLPIQALALVPHNPGFRSLYFVSRDAGPSPNMLLRIAFRRCSKRMFVFGKAS